MHDSEWYNHNKVRSSTHETNKNVTAVEVVSLHLPLPRISAVSSLASTQRVVYASLPRTITVTDRAGTFIYSVVIYRNCPKLAATSRFSLSIDGDHLMRWNLIRRTKIYRRIIQAWHKTSTIARLTDGPTFPPLVASTAGRLSRPACCQQLGRSQRHWGSSVKSSKLSFDTANVNDILFVSRIREV